MPCHSLKVIRMDNIVAKITANLISDELVIKANFLKKLPHFRRMH